MRGLDTSSTCKHASHVQTHARHTSVHTRIYLHFYTQVGLVSGGTDGYVKIWGSGGDAARRASEGRAQSAGQARQQSAASTGQEQVLRKYDVRELAADGMQVPSVHVCMCVDVRVCIQYETSLHGASKLHEPVLCRIMQYRTSISER
jgi:hypothetical protein